MVLVILSFFIIIGVTCQPPFTNIDEECLPKDENGIPLPKLIGGVNASWGEFPFMVSLQEPHGNDELSYHQHFCAGTLINRRLILTAAHCIWNSQFGVNHREVTGDLKNGTVDKRIKAAINPYCRHQEGAKLLGIGTFYIHPDYQGDTSGGADIALLVLDEGYNGTVSFPDYENPAGFDSTDQLIIMGWGFTNSDEADDPNLYISSVIPLQKGYVTMKDSCSFENTFCASGVNEDGETIDTCRGDSGGPVIVMDGNDFVQVGITSYGEGGDCVGNTMGIYTRISYYKEWIDFVIQGENIVDPQDLPTTSSTSIESEGGCISYSTLGPNQVASDEGSSLRTPNGGIFMRFSNAEFCAAACEALNAQCDSICCDSFSFNAGKQECWLKKGSQRDTYQSSDGWQSYWRENDDSTGSIKVCEEDWKAEGYIHAYMTKGPRQLSVNEGISLALPNGQRSSKVSSVDRCAFECEQVPDCNSFSYNPSSSDCYIKQGQTFETRDDNAGWQSYWQLPESTAQIECVKSNQYCIYCGGTINECRSY